MGRRSSGSRRRARRWTREEASTVLAALKASGLSLASFARGAGIDPQRLRAWRQRLGDGTALAAMTPAFVEIPRRTAELIDVVLPSGVIVRVSEAVDPGALRRIAAALSDETSC